METMKEKFGKLLLWEDVWKGQGCLHNFDHVKCHHKPLWFIGFKWCYKLAILLIYTITVCLMPLQTVLICHLSTSDTIASRITHHAEFTPSFSPEGFDLPKAYFATAQSIHDSLIVNWNATYDMYERSNVKQAYYLSMEFLQGRALLNAIGNLELTGAYGEALSKLGHKLEDVVSQEPDAALENGGLGRLASGFLDSLATLNYPAWGYGLRYKYGLFKQLITKDGQEEIAENWLEMGNPWEIVRNDISYPIKFYGKVVTGSDGKRRWIGGEDIVAVASDVPIPGYKTKTTINLRLWSTKVPSANFDLSASVSLYTLLLDGVGLLLRRTH